LIENFIAQAARAPSHPKLNKIKTKKKEGITKDSKTHTSKKETTATTHQSTSHNTAQNHDTPKFHGHDTPKVNHAIESDGTPHTLETTHAQK